MMGNVGGALMFFGSMLIMLLLGLYTLAYASHVALTIIEGTANGGDEITWTSEPFVDWLWEFAYLAWLVALWLIPLGFVSKWLLQSMPASTALPTLVAVMALLYWLLFPISLMSSMSASSRWIVLSPTLFPRLLQRAGSVLTFFVLTAPVLVIAALAFDVLLVWGPLVIIPLAAMVMTALMFVYFRLFGRLALELRFTRGQDPKARTIRRRPTSMVEAADRVAAKGPANIARATDLPPVDAPDEDARIGYDLRTGSSTQRIPEPALQRPPADPADGSYELADGPPEAVIARGPIPERLSKPSDYELALAGRGRGIGRTERPWTSNVWSFPFAASNAGPLTWLTLGFAATGAMFRLMLSFMPD